MAINDERVHEIIKKYFYEQYSYEEIVAILKTYDVDIELRQLKRILQKLNSKRHDKEENIHDIILAIMNELQGSGKQMGYKAMWLRLQLPPYNLFVYRDTVMELLRILDPEGVEGRSKYKLKRREYKVAGPNYIWHLDGLKFINLFINLFIFLTNKVNKFVL